MSADIGLNIGKPDAGLDFGRLSNVRNLGGKTVAACPACREAGGDSGGDHLMIDGQGRFGCVSNPGPAGAEHRKRIFALAGVSGNGRKITPLKAPLKAATAAKSGRVHPTIDAAAAAALRSVEKATGRPHTQTRVDKYFDATGATVAAVLRFDSDNAKTYRPIHATGDGWALGDPPGQWPLYGLRDILKGAGPVYVTEGEKAAESGLIIGLPCVAAAHGAKSADKSDWAPVAGRPVVVLPDNDSPGMEYAEKVAALATEAGAASVKILALPGLPEKGDLHEFIEARDEIDAADIVAEIQALADAVSPWTPDGGAILDGAALLRDDPPPHDPVLSGLFDRRALVEIVGPSKTRKSFAVIQLALSLAAGRDVFGFESGGRFSVMVADFELSDADIRRRVWRMGRALDIKPDDIGGRLRILPLAGKDNSREAIQAAAVGFDIVICDPLYALCDGAESIENFREPLRWLRRLAVERVACLFVHHDAKGTAGDRENRDRGSGSGITGRAVDARIVLTPAAGDPDNSVCMAFMCRSYLAPEPTAWIFENDAFRESDLPAEPERQSDRRARALRPKLEGYEAGALRILADAGPMSPAVFKRRLRDELNTSKGDADTLTSALCEPDGPARRWREGGFNTAWQIGLKDDLPSSCLPTGKKREEGTPYLQPPAYKGREEVGCRDIGK